MIFHAFAAEPPTVVVLPFVLRLETGPLRHRRWSPTCRPTLGPWPHFAHFELTLSRRFRYRGRQRSYLSASCPIPKQFTAGFFSFAKASFTLAGGGGSGPASPAPAAPVPTSRSIRALRLANPVAGQGRWVTVSIGAATAVATAGGTVQMPEGLLQSADSALYKAKAAGRNNIKTALLMAPAKGAARVAA